MAYDVAGVACSLYLFVKLIPEATGLRSPLVSTFASQPGTERLIFNLSEMLFLVEIVFHLVGWQELKRNVLLFNLWALMLAFLVIPFYPSHPMIIYWVLLRQMRKCVRISHHFYASKIKKQSKKAKLSPFERFCIDLLTFSFPLEYAMSVVLVLLTYPLIQHSSAMNIPLTSGTADREGWSLCLAPLYLCSLAATVPCFVVSLVQVWRKREKLVYEKVYQKK